MIASINLSSRIRAVSVRHVSRRSFFVPLGEQTKSSKIQENCPRFSALTATAGLAALTLVVASGIGNTENVSWMEEPKTSGGPTVTAALDAKNEVMQSTDTKDADDHEPQNTEFTASGFLEAIESNDKSLLSKYVWLKPDDKEDPASAEGYNPEDVFMSHYGLETKTNLVVPFARMMKEVYGHSFFVDCEPDKAYSKSRGEMQDVLRRALWSSPVAVFVISRNFHKSPWCLKELYTALYREKCEGDRFKVHIFYYGTDPGLCDLRHEYRGLDIGKTFGTLFKFENMSLESFAVDKVHPTVRQLIKKDDDAELKPRERVLAEFRKHCPMKSLELFVGAFHVPKPLPYFEGRRQEMNRLTELLSTNKFVTVCPHGIGGIGKTQLVTTWVNKNVERYAAVVWLRAEHELTLMDDLASFARVIGVSSPMGASENVEEAATRAIKAIESRSENDLPILLVYDNAMSYNDVKKWMPATGSACHSIVTTRDNSGFGQEVLVRLGPLDPESSIRIVEHFIQRSLNETEHKNLLQLLGSFGFLPLAIAVFATQACYLGVPRAIRRFRERRQEVLGRNLNFTSHYDGDNRESVSTVLRMQLDSLSPEALLALEHLSVVDAERVPLSLLEASLNESADADIALQELQEKAVVFFDGRHELINIHRLLQDSAWEAMSEERKTSVLNDVGSELLNIFEGVDIEAGRNETLTRALPHALAIVGRPWPKENKIFGDLCFVLGRAHGFAGNYQDALALYTRALPVLKASLGDNHPSVATTLNGIALVYDKQGLYDKALALYEQALSVYKASMGDNHPSVATTLNNMAGVYKNQGFYDKALELFEQALSIYKSSLGDNHPHVATTLNNMAMVYYNQGLCDKALKMYEQALSIFKASLGDNHPEVATILNNMAVEYYNQGLYDKALELFEQALSIRKASLGDNHPSVATTLNNMASVYDNQGLYDKALELYNQVLSIEKASVGDNHPNVATTLNNMAYAYRNQGLYDKALELFERALSIRRAFLRSDHPYIVQVLNAIDETKKQLAGDQ